jgi:hypothetical protein
MGRKRTDGESVGREFLECFADTLVSEDDALFETDLNLLPKREEFPPRRRREG